MPETTSVSDSFIIITANVFCMQTTTTVQRVKGGTWNKHKKKYYVVYSKIL